MVQRADLLRGGRALPSTIPADTKSLFALRRRHHHHASSEGV